MSDTGAHDVIVVGGGPSGSTAAYQLEELGYDVLLIDKETFPRDKLCGGLVTNKTVRLIERVFNTTEQQLVDEGIVDYAANEFEVYFDDDLLHRGSIEIPLYFAKRHVYDTFLFKQARKAGVDTIENEGVTEVDSSIAQVKTEDGKTFDAKYVIAADGANSVIRSQLVNDGLIQAPNWRKNMAMALECYVPRSDTSIDPDVPLVHFGVVDWGYGWVFPNQDRLLIGVGGLNRRNGNFRNLIEEYFDTVGFDADNADIKGHPLPFGNFIERPAANQVLLVGDAAGTVESITGEGLFYGQRSGEIAAWSIHRATQGDTDSPTADYYTELIQEYVHPELEHSRTLRPLLWAGPKAPRRPLMKAAMKVGYQPFNELIQGIRVYPWLRSKGRALHDIV